MDLLVKFIWDEEGQAMAEYILIFAIVSVALITALEILGVSIVGIADNSNEEIGDAIN